MGLGQKLARAIASNFIEVRLGTEGAPRGLTTDEAEPTPVPAPPLLTPEGELNDAAVYAGSLLPEVAFTAEQAISVLEDLPTTGTAASLRCETMLEALQVLGGDPAEVAQQVVSDAAQKLVAVHQFVARRREEAKLTRRELVQEMDELHERLNELRLQLEETGEELRQVEEAGRARVDNLTGVIAFFDEFQAFLRAPRSAVLGQEELPAYLRDETAFKLLGVAKEPRTG